MGHLLYGYKLNEEGRVIHKMMDSDRLFSQEMKQEGWRDSPDKVEGNDEFLAAQAARQAEADKTFSPEPRPTGEVYGSERAIEKQERRAAKRRQRDTRTGRFL